MRNGQAKCGHGNWEFDAVEYVLIQWNVQTYYVIENRGVSHCQKGEQIQYDGNCTISPTPSQMPIHQSELGLTSSPTTD